MDTFLSTLPGWVGIVLVAAVVGGGWFAISRLGGRAAGSAQRRAAITAARARASGLRPRYASGSAALTADPDAFALAASAWLAHASQQPLEPFAYANPNALDRMLASYYGVHSRDELEPEIVRLLLEGHRAWPHGDAEGPIDFAVWDLVRVIELCRAGLGLGVLTEVDARDTARFAAATLQARYADWTSLGSQLERAFRHTHEEVSRHTERLARIECDGIRGVMQATDGPWSLVPGPPRWPAASCASFPATRPQFAGRPQRKRGKSRSGPSSWAAEPWRLGDQVTSRRVTPGAPR